MVLVFLVNQTLDNLKVDTVASEKRYLLIDEKCKTRWIITHSDPGEKYGVFCARHDEEVAAAIKQYGEKAP